MITGTTKTVGIIGWPVEHSLSPALHNAAFGQAGLDYVYVPLPVRPNELGSAVSGLKSLGFVGANVTIPHKVNIMPFLDEIDRSAQQVGAVNTVVIADGRAVGYNTDAEGFVQSLFTAGICVKGKNAVLIGAGGAARAVICGLHNHGVGQLVVAARVPEKAREFASGFSEIKVEVQGYGWDEAEFCDALDNCDILIQCTPVGMFPHTEEEIHFDWARLNPAAVVCDLIYNPPLTRFLLTAKARNHQILNGAGMLLEQGALAFTLWTGVKAPRQVMADVLQQDR